MGWPGARRTYADFARPCDSSAEERDAALFGVTVADGIGEFGIGASGIGGQFLRPAYEQAIDGTQFQPPLPVRSDPAVGAFIRDSGVPTTVLMPDGDAGYTPTWTDEDGIGTAAIGVTPLGYMRPYHQYLEVRFLGLDPAGPLYPVLEPGAAPAAPLPASAPMPNPGGDFAIRGPIYNDALDPEEDF